MEQLGYLAHVVAMLFLGSVDVGWSVARVKCEKVRQIRGT